MEENLNWKTKYILQWDKGGKKFKYVFENLIIPYPFKPGTFTNWWNWNQTKPHPTIDLPTNVGILAQSQEGFW